MTVRSGAMMLLIAGMMRLRCVIGMRWIVMMLLIIGIGFRVITPRTSLRGFMMSATSLPITWGAWRRWRPIRNDVIWSQALESPLMIYSPIFLSSLRVVASSGG